MVNPSLTWWCRPAIIDHCFLRITQIERTHLKMFAEDEEYLKPAHITESYALPCMNALCEVLDSVGDHASSPCAVLGLVFRILRSHCDSCIIYCLNRGSHVRRWLTGLLDGFVRLLCKLIGWLIDCLICCWLAYWLTDWLSGWLAVCLLGLLVGWLIA